LVSEVSRISPATRTAAHLIRSGSRFQLSYSVIGVYAISTAIWWARYLGLIRGRALLMTCKRDVKDTERASLERYSIVGNDVEKSCLSRCLRRTTAWLMPTASRMSSIGSARRVEKPHHHGSSNIFHVFLRLEMCS
jgi:hypothetical protein